MEPPARNWISTLHRISDIKSNEFLPLVSPQYLDKTPKLSLVKRTNGKKKLLVLRLWESNRTIQGTQEPLWVGTVGFIPRSYSWLFHKHHDIDIDPTLILQSSAVMRQWEWKVLVLPVPGKNDDLVEQKILLIRQKK